MGKHAVWQGLEKACFGEQHFKKSLVKFLGRADRGVEFCDPRDLFGAVWRCTYTYATCGSFSPRGGGRLLF